MAYGDFKYLPRGTASDKILHNKAFNTANVPNMMDINVDFFHWFIDFFNEFLDKKSSLRMHGQRP